MKQYQDDFRQEREDRETAHGLIADMEKECIKGGEMSNYQQLSDAKHFFDSHSNVENYIKSTVEPLYYGHPWDHIKCPD